MITSVVVKMVIIWYLLRSNGLIFVMITGIFSLISGPNLLKKIGINSKAAKGLAMGTSAQMLGASRSMLWGEEEGAMGSAAMTTTAILFPILIPILSTFL